MSDQPLKISITLIGLDTIGITSLNSKLQQIIINSDFGYAPRRCLATLSKIYKNHNFKAYPKPLLDNVFKSIENYHKAHPSHNIVLLTTGDPMWFGLGSSIVKHRPSWSLCVFPSVSGLQLACARMPWSIQDTKFLSLHGRPKSSLLANLSYNSKLVILGHDQNTPADIARVLLSVDPEGSKTSFMTVMENLGTKKENITKKPVVEWQNSLVDPWHCIGLSWKGLKIENSLGIDDQEIENDGALTKKALRILAIATLRPKINKLLWDIGAGCGGISIEWCLQGGQSLMLEPKPERRKIIQRNLVKFGINHKANIFSELMPTALQESPWLNSKPDAIFIGGGLSQQDARKTVDKCINKLNHNGVILAHALTLNSEEVLLQVFKNFGGKLERFESEEAVKYKNTNTYGWNPRRRVLQWSFTKT